MSIHIWRMLACTYYTWSYLVGIDKSCIIFITLFPQKNYYFKQYCHIYRWSNPRKYTDDQILESSMKTINLHRRKFGWAIFYLFYMYLQETKIFTMKSCCSLIGHKTYILIKSRLSMIQRIKPWFEILEKWFNSFSINVSLQCPIRATMWKIERGRPL